MINPALWTRGIDKTGRVELTAQEKDFIRNQFIALDGCLTDNEKTRLTPVTGWCNAINVGRGFNSPYYTTTNVRRAVTSGSEKSPSFVMTQGRAKIRFYRKGEATPFQISSFVNRLHKEVADGTIVIVDKAAYDKNLEAHRARYPKRYPELAAKYGHKMITPRVCKKLIAKEHETFWKFYKKHLTEFEEPLSWVCENSQHMEPNDLRSEVLLRLERNRVDLKWDPDKAGLLTFLTHRIRGYAQHVLDLSQYRPTWQGKGVADKWRMSRAQTESEDGDFQVTSDGFEDEFDAVDTLRAVRKHIPENLRPVFDRQAEGMTYAQIAKATGVAQNNVSAKAHAVRDQATLAYVEMERKDYVQANF